jgi:hypothetical protein
VEKGGDWRKSAILTKRASDATIDRITCVYRRSQEKRGGHQMKVQIGKEAPDFTAKAYYAGAAQAITLSDRRGKWVMLCFYPADFTCV